MSGPGAARTLLLCVAPVLLLKDSRGGETEKGGGGGRRRLENGVSDRDTVRDTYTQGEAGRQTACGTGNQRETESE